MQIQSHNLTPAGHSVTMSLGVIKRSDSGFDRHIVLTDALDIKPAVDYTLNHILQDQKRGISEGKKYVVLIGKAHTVAAHKVFETALISSWANVSEDNDWG